MGHTTRSRRAFSPAAAVLSLLLLAPAPAQVTNAYLPDGNATAGVIGNMIPFSSIFGTTPGSWSHLTIVPAWMLAARGAHAGDKLVDIQFAPCGSGTLHMPNVQVIVGHLVSPLPTFSLANGFSDQTLVYDSAASGPLDFHCVANTWCSLGVGGGGLAWNGASDVGIYTTHAGLTISTTTGWQGSFWREATLMRHYVNSYQATMALTSSLNGLKIGLVFANPATLPAAMSEYGQGAPGSLGVPAISAPELPTFGNNAFGFGVFQALPGATAVLLVSSGAASEQIGVGADVRVLVDLSLAANWYLVPIPVSGFGTASFGAAVPNYAPGLAGLRVYCQWAIVGDPNAPMTTLGVPLSFSDGLSITVGI